MDDLVDCERADRPRHRGKSACAAQRSAEPERALEESPEKRIQRHRRGGEGGSDLTADLRLTLDRGVETRSDLEEVRHRVLAAQMHEPVTDAVAGQIGGYAVRSLGCGASEVDLDPVTRRQHRAIR